MPARKTKIESDWQMEERHRIEWHAHQRGKAPNKETEEEIRARHLREAEERDAAQKAHEQLQSDRAKAQLAAYLADKKRKPVRADWGGNLVYRFEEDLRETDTAVRYNETEFFVSKDGTVRIFKKTSTSQKFLVVSGPMKGKRIIHDYTDPEYVLYNCSYSTNRRSKKEAVAEKCVLVHKSSFGR